MKTIKIAQISYPLISVLVPVYNQAPYIQACLDSILHDGYPNLEVIVLDDGSVDSTYDIVNQWFHSYGKSLFSYSLIRQDNQGVTKTLNSMLRKFSGDYFVLLAGDDVLLHGGISERLAALENMPKALAVFGDAIAIDEFGIKICNSVLVDRYRASIRSLLNRHMRAYEIILNWCIPGPVFLAKREVLKEVGYYNENFLIEDRDYYLRLLASDRLAFTATKVAAYRIHSAASTGTIERRVRVGQEVMRIEEHNLKYFHGLKRLALWLVIRKSAMNFQLITGKKGIVCIAQAFIIRVAVLVLKCVFRFVAYLGKWSI